MVLVYASKEDMVSAKDIVSSQQGLLGTSSSTIDSCKPDKSFSN